MRPIKWILGILGGFFLLTEIVGSFFISSARISSRSMSPGYERSDRILISRVGYGMTLPFSDYALPISSALQRGQVIMLKAPYSSEKHLPVLRDLWDFFTLNSPPPGNRAAWKGGRILRRIIALPGDKVYLDAGEAYVQIQGSGDFFSESFTSIESYNLLLPGNEFANPDLLNNYYTSTFSVPEGEIFVLPDNRLEAFGSESWGTVSLRSIRGHVLRRY